MKGYKEWATPKFVYKSWADIVYEAWVFLLLSWASKILAYSRPHFHLKTILST